MAGAKAPRTAIFKWTGVKEQALWFVFEGTLSLDKIALNCAIAPRTLDLWVAHPAFRQRLEQMRADLDAAIGGAIYVSKTSRVLALSEMAQAARKEFEKRPWLKEVRPTKDGKITNEHFNSEAYAAFRGALDDIAKEKGDRKNVTELTGKDGGPVEISDARQRLATRLADLAARRRAAGAAEQPE